MSKPSDVGSTGTPPNGDPRYSSDNSVGSGGLYREIFDSEADSTRQFDHDEFSGSGRDYSSEGDRVIPPPPPFAPPRSASSMPPAPPAPPSRPPVRTQSGADAFPPPPPPPPPPSSAPTTAPSPSTPQAQYGAAQSVSPQGLHAGYAPAGYTAVASGHVPHQQEEPKKNKSKPPWAVVTFTTVLALFLVGAGLYIFFDMRSSDGQVESTKPPTAGDPSGASDSDDSSSDFDSSEAEAFITPSGNISCVIYKDRARCTVSSFEYSPGEQPDDCSGGVEWGSVAEVTESSAGFTCKSVGEAPSPKELGYGKTIKAHGFECSSQRDGVRCTGPGGSFHVRKGDFNFK
ncbi:hypothetical protein [Brevibacterium sp. HMSC07C04]|uniref:hypothetical protein n=1 Tax=Brevibacterium sp. HMSC07C04 TaxID=1581130 RepID=UPI0008A2843E|nr:hypothetical protein [Brevibacterium sp. HMSC07C04]OFS27263.1 hypothetical protein HMPREF3162_02455 [Brevibacterium sp. HMSC07C04]